MTASPEGLEPPASALAVVAHPDDAEFQCGATLAKWASSGCVVHHLILTDGSKGTWDPDADVSALAERRRAEQRSAAAALGARGEVVFLDRVDGELTADHATRGAVAEVIRRLRPAVVLAHDPWRRYRLHPDHRAAGQLAVDGVVAARDPFFHREQLRDGLRVHRPEALLLFEADEVNHLEEVGEADLHRKLSALECHESQLETTHFYGTGTDDRAAALEAFRLRQRSQLEAIAGGADRPYPMAEAFHLIRERL